MNLERALSCSPRVTDYLERYVNDGSPSGYTLHDQMSPKTNPLGLEPFFHPLRIKPVGCRTETHLSSLFSCPPELLIPLAHPDAASELASHGVATELARDIRVVPTSSGRTCRLLDDERGYFIKLHYPGLLGRIDRAMPRHKSLAGIEVSDEVAAAISDGNLPTKLAIMPEVACVVTCPDASPTHTFGHVVRRSAAYPDTPPSARIPLFALWAIDRLAPLDAPLLEQIFESSPDLGRQLVEDTIVTLIDFFFCLWSSTGLLYEVNAQNTLIEIDDTLRLKRVVIRDFNSTEKDLAQRNKLGRTSNFASGRYKILAAEDKENARLRRSFAFDFKLCNYAVSPLIEAAARFSSVESKTYISFLKDIVSHSTSGIPKDFFPIDGSWWSHPDVDLSSTRPYVQNRNPMLR